MAVIAHAREAEFKLETVDAEMRGTRQGQAGIGRVGGIVDIKRLSITIPRGNALDLIGQHAGDIDLMAQAVLDELDRFEL